MLTVEHDFPDPNIKEVIVPERLTGLGFQLIADGLNPGDIYQVRIIPSDVLSFPDYDLTIDKNNGIIKTSNGTLKPPKKQLQLVHFLARMPNTLRTYEQVMSYVWTNEEPEPKIETLREHMSKLRGNLVPLIGVDPIHNVRGKGYLFCYNGK